MHATALYYGAPHQCDRENAGKGEGVTTGGVAEPAAAGIEEQGFGWKNKCGNGNAGDTITSGLEGAWTMNPAQWTHQYLTNLFAYDWVKTKSPAGATQWIPKDEAAANLVPDAHDKTKRHAPFMLTTDLALKADLSYEKIARRFLENPKEFEQRDFALHTCNKRDGFHCV